MNKNGKYYAEIGIKAARRAAEKVILRAHQENKPMPVWDGEKVQYTIPSMPKALLTAKRGD